MISLVFHGGAGTVTGSKFLFGVDGEDVLVDCGMFQGLKELRERNWQAPPFDAARLNWLILTHAHIDHTGWVPRLVKSGFRGQILCTHATRDVAQILLMDSAHLQQEEADYRNKQGISSHAPALPLYTQEDVQRAMALFRPVGYDAWTELSRGIAFRLVDVGHILGSAAVQLRLRSNGREVMTLVSGDVGRYDMPLHPDPLPAPACDVLLLESTYGDRPHAEVKAEDQLLAVARRAQERGGLLIVPAFAVGRSQQVLFILHELFESGRLKRMPVYLDSPMGIDATRIYCEYAGRYRLDPQALKNGICVFYDKGIKIVKEASQSRKLARLQGPAVVISSNGMLSGGRILHHLKNFLPDPKNIVAVVGYQAVGTRGRYLLQGAKTFKVFREEIPVRAEVADLRGFSGHADAKELLRWTAACLPSRCFLVHGEPHAAAALAERLKAERGWKAEAAQAGQTVEL